VNIAHFSGLAVWRGPMRRDTVLHVAIALSLVVHAILLVIRFVPADALRFKSMDNPLEVILVNARSQTMPVKAEAAAQAHLNGGGEHDKGRARSFLPRAATVEDSDALQQSQRNLARLEEQQKKLLSQMQATATAVTPEPPQQKAPEPPRPRAPLDARESARAIARMEAQVDKQISDYNARPRRGFIGPSTKAVSYAMYYSQWKDKVERVGTINYPEEARGRLYGELTLVVALNPDGTIYNDHVEVTQSSGSAVLDRAAIRIVRLSAPFGRFGPEMRRDYDVFEIVTRFSFTRGDGFEALK
jgi:protein TonB